MEVITATAASRSFSELLDRVERGESIIVTRGGRRVALVAPALAANGAAVADLLRTGVVDIEFERDVREVRNAVELEVPAWPEG